MSYFVIDVKSDHYNTNVEHQPSVFDIAVKTSVPDLRFFYCARQLVISCFLLLSIMSAIQEKTGDDISPAIERTQSYGEGITMKLDDKENREFYGDSITDSYRLKSELVGKCLQEIGMGRLVKNPDFWDASFDHADFCADRYQWELFVVTGFGWITDNL